MLHKSAAFSGVLSHKISTPPTRWPGESKFSSGQLSTQSSAKNTVESRNARCWCASCPTGKKEERQGLVQIRLGLYWRDPTVNSRPKENRLEVRGPLVPYLPRTSSFRAKKDRPCPFLSPFRLLLCFVPIESKAKQKWFVCLLYLLDEREHTFFRFRVYGLDSVSVTPSF
ncbi:hypothetical protein CFP56_020348 [Quercus suber]|uniref:Uncharacterized protein n=1 Tax=Quercus suber TaxID=58331 RepID=A0AAW0KFX5_QUESU